ncbi:MAG: DUF4493 domain-containing protein [Alistipes sp.]|jgi:hypothetical protein|nr:DUF4493 domain-containing protein [Alistipes sp.]
MKHRTLFALPAVLAGILLSGCAADGETRGGSGTIDLQLTASSEAVVVEATRGTIPGITAPEESQFSLVIVKDGANPATSPRWDDITQYPTDNKLQVGGYTATAAYGDPDSEGFERPAFGVSEHFEVLHGQTVTVALEARLVNTAVTMEYTDDFKNYFSDYTVTVVNEGADAKTFVKDETRAMFVRPEAFSLRLDYTRQSSGRSGTVSYDMADLIEGEVAACTHYKVGLDINEGHVGGAAIVINLDGNIEEIPLEIEVGEGE